MTQDALPLRSPADEKRARYHAVSASIDALLEDEDDWIAALATVVCELHHAFEAFDWTGFYRVIANEMLVIGPYQGTHGCLRIPFSKGVCGAAARSKTTQLVPDVEAFPGHIACSATTRSELVVPLLRDGIVIAVLDIDSNAEAAFDEVDQQEVEAICASLVKRFTSASALS